MTSGLIMFSAWKFDFGAENPKSCKILVLSGLKKLNRATFTRTDFPSFHVASGHGARGAWIPECQTQGEALAHRKSSVCA